VAALDTMPTFIARHSLNQNCQVSFTNINFDTNALSLIPEITHSETVNNERFYVNSSGEYLIISRLRSDTVDVSARLAIQAVVNDLTVLTDSSYDTGTGPAADSNSIHLSFVTQLVSGTYVTVQALKSSPGESWLANETMVQFVKLTGVAGTSGFSSPSGFSGPSGPSGWSGNSGWSGTYSGASGISGVSGWSATSGWSGLPGYSGTVGESGYSGNSGFSGTYSGASGISGISGWSGEMGPSGPSGIGLSGFSGVSPSIALNENDTAYVDPEFGNDATGQVEALNKPFKTIQAAIDACSAQSPSATSTYTVKVNPGQFVENLTMASFVNVLGSGDNLDTNVVGTVSFVGLSSGCEIGSCTITSSNAPCVIVDIDPGVYASIGGCWMQSFWDNDPAVACTVECRSGVAFIYAGSETDISKTNSFAGSKVVAPLYMTGSAAARIDMVGGTTFNYTYDEDDSISVLYSDNTSYESVGLITGGFSEVYVYGAVPANMVHCVYHKASNANTLVSNHVFGMFLPMFVAHGCNVVLEMSESGVFPQSGISLNNVVVNVQGAIAGQTFIQGATGVYDACIMSFVSLATFLGDIALSRYTALGSAGRCKNIVGDDDGSFHVTSHIKARGFGQAIVPTTGPVYGFSGNDYSVLADSTSSDVTINLWAPYHGQVANVKKTSPNNQVIIDGVTNTIEGLGYSMALVGDNESVTLQYYSGFSSWYRIGLGASGISGASAWSGESGQSGWSGASAWSGNSGHSGTSAWSGNSGVSGWSGQSGWSGTSAWSGNSGVSAWSGQSGWSGASAWSGVSGFSGWSGTSAWSGASAWSGVSGQSGWSGASAWSGLSGWSGLGFSGPSGPSGPSGTSGFSSFSGESGSSGTSGAGNSGYSGQSAFSGFSGGGTGTGADLWQLIFGV